jgi:hypothetical protein
MPYENTFPIDSFVGSILIPIYFNISDVYPFFSSYVVFERRHLLSFVSQCITIFPQRNIWTIKENVFCRRNPLIIPPNTIVKVII